MNKHALGGRIILNKSTCSAAILAGGEAARMGGLCKALLPLGERSFLARQAETLAGFGELLLSTNEPSLAQGLPLRPVADLVPGAGPLSGLHACLLAAESPALLVLPCDVPLLPALLVDRLIAQWEGWEDALVCQDSSGHVHPLCGIYHKRCLPTLEKSLRGQRFSVLRLLERMNSRLFQPDPAVFPDRIFCNINTPADYRALLEDFRGL